MKRKLIIYISFQFALGACLAQNNIDIILDQIESNNKSIQTNEKYWDAQRREYMTGLALNNPEIEYDYLFGSPANAGNQKEFSIIQRMDFPTTYAKRKELSERRIASTDIEKNIFRQDIILEAKLLLLELIYLNKKENQLQLRVSLAEQMVNDYQQKLEKGDANILDANKTRFQFVNIKNEIALLQNERQITLTRLAAINGGSEIDFTDTIFPILPPLPEFATLDSTIEANDPVIRRYEQQKFIYEQEVRLQKSLNLPKVEAGYHYQGFLGQNYSGVHAGISIPIWENKNKVQAAKARVVFSSFDIDRHRLEHRMENKMLYELLEVRRNSLEEYNQILNSLNNTRLLDKALEYGEITIIQYIMEQTYFFNAIDKNLLLEFEYQKAMTELYKYTL